MLDLWFTLSQHVTPTFNIFSLEIHYYGILLSLGVLAGISVSTRLTDFKDENYWWWLIIGSLIGARTYHVLDQLNYYLANPKNILGFTQGGLAIYGAFAGSAVATLAYSRIHRIRILKLFDILSLAAPLAQAIGRWGNFFNMEAFGPPTNLPWGIYISAVNRPPFYQAYERFHPLFLYESLLNLLLFAIILKTHQARSNPAEGHLFSKYLIGYGLIRFFLEIYRNDTWVTGSLKVAHVLSAIIILIGIALHLHQKHKITNRKIRP